MNNFISYIKNHGYMTAIALSFLYITPLMIANFYYIDDVSRSVGGYARWIDNGRPLAEWIIILMGFGGVVDIFPAPLILCAVVMITSGYYLCKKIGVTNKYSAIIISLSILCSPFYIQNLSYRYDAFTMGLSVSLAIISSSVIYNTKNYLCFAVSAIAITAMMSLYQASLNAYIGVVCVLSIISMNTYGLKTTTAYCIKSIASLLIGMIIYKIFIAEVFVSGGYSVTHSETVKVSYDSLDVISRNIKSFMYVFDTTFSGRFGMIFYSAFFISCTVCIITSYNSHSSYKFKIYNILFSFIAMSLLLFSIVGMMFSLKHPIFYPRVFIGFIGVMIFISIFTSVFIGGWLRLVPVILILCSFSQMFAYGNALNSQKQKEDFIFSTMANDIINYNGKINKIRFNGRSGESQTSRFASTRFGVMLHIVPTYIRPDWMFGAFYFGRMGVNVIYDLNIDLQKAVKEGCENPYKENSIYTTIVHGDTMIFDFNRCN
ncbi:glucosyltransferase domain-containing protein [Escherichia coli]|uniref:glucosyltransferase domain-containing protein n=1 Tax=Escherichia coli TaxID=562 RepID=UPI0027383239|nr:glucosyltransferase domain-containing protein [Escherichia coli]HAW3413661.1 hypothetical protein [Escherichia coli]